MELFDKETIYGIVADGRYNRRKAALMQGAPLTKEQRDWWDEAEIAATAEEDERKERARRVDRAAYGGGENDGPMTGAERVRKHMALKASIDEVLDDAMTRINRRRRARAMRSFPDFVNTYGTKEGAFLEDAPPPSMLPILENMQTAVDDSSVPFHVRIARGHGKTSYGKLLIAWAVATGRRKYCVVVGSNAENARGILDDVLAFFTECPEFAQDFPEISVPLAALNGVYQRARSQTYRGKATKIKLGMGFAILPTVEGSAAAGAIIRSCGFDSNARGMVKGKQRPDFVLLDDLQKDDLAGNPDRVLAAVAHIKKTFLGLAGHRKKIAALMTSTPIEPDDLSEVFARDPSWRTTTYQMIELWPTAWKTDDPQYDYWGQYRDILQREITAGNKTPHIVANKFYADHRAEMDAGAKVLNPNNYDRKTELSGIQHAMNLLIRDGEEVFDCEYQMKPRRHAYAFEITAEMVLGKRRIGSPSLWLPKETEIVVATTDINPSYGLTTAITAFEPDRTAHVTAYHVTPIHIDDSANDTQYHREVYEALAEHAREIKAVLPGIRLDWWGIDAGGKQIAPVTRFVQEGRAAELSGAKNALAMIGRAWRNWNERPRNALRAAVNMTVTIKGQNGRRFTMWNADYYKETMQRSWGSEIGAPGGLTLFDGGVDHTKFAIQIANEVLKVKKKLIDCYDYKWQTANPHDYGDCLAMAYAIAGMVGITGDARERPAAKKSRVVFL